MEASDMLDVLHYLLDEDLSFSSGEEAQAKSRVRSTLYQNIYEKEYKYVISTSDSGIPSNDNFGGAVTNELKPYIPPTPFNPDSPNPFQGSLRENPLG